MFLQTMYEPREGGKEGGMLICTYMHMCMHMTTTPEFAFVYMGFIFVWTYLGIVLKSEHVWVFIFWLYCISCTYGKRKRSSQKKEKEK